jgi:hypothetical protein
MTAQDRTRSEDVVLAKLRAGRTQDLADVVAILKLGDVPVTAILETLDGADREDFARLVEIAALEVRGEGRTGRWILLSILRRRWGTGDPSP